MLEYITLWILFTNKLISTNLFLYFIFFALFLNIFIFLKVSDNFFKIILNFIFLIINSIILSYINSDFFSAFLLSAELPVILILLIFYFHKNSLQIDSLYNYNIKSNNVCIYVVIFVMVFLYCSDLKSNIHINTYNFIINDSLFIKSKNDFLILHYILYKLNYNILLISAFLILLVSILTVLAHQIFKIKNNDIFILKKNKQILRKQNMLKQGTYKSKLHFFFKK